MGRLHALFVLAWGLLRSLLASALRRPPGPGRFPPELRGRPPAAPHARTSDGCCPGSSGCIACGLCDVGEGAAMARSGGRYAGVMDLMLASSRNMPDYDAAARRSRPWATSGSPSSRPRCPARVPMRELAAFVRSKAAEMSVAVRE